jgi:hypothetical protein
MAFGLAKPGGLSYDPSHNRAKVRSAVLIVGDLGEQCGASDPGQKSSTKQLEIFNTS